MIRKCFLAFSILFFGAVSRAADPPQGAIRLFIPFIKSTGLFNYLKSDQFPDTYAQTLNNVDWSRNGLMQSRKGIQQIVDLAPSSLGNFIVGYRSVQGARNNSFWIYRSTTSHYYFMARIEDVLENAPVDGYYDAAFPQFLKTGQVEALQINGDFFMVNEVTAIIKVTEVQPYLDVNGGANPCTVTSDCLKLSYVPNSPSGTILKTHLDRFLVAGSTIAGQESTLFYSSGTTFDGPDIYSWPPENTVELFTRSTERITCIGDPIFGNVPIYTNFTTRLITGSDYGDDVIPGNINVRVIYDGIGCSSERSVKNIRNKQYFFSAGEGGQWAGIYEFNGVSVKEMTVPLRTFFKNVVQNSTATLATAFLYENKYCLNVATNGWDRLTTVICLDDQNRLEFMQPLQAAMTDTLNGQTYFIANSSDVGLANQYHVYFYDYNKGGDKFRNVSVITPITWTYKTKDFPINDENMSRMKVPERVYFKTETTTFSCQISVTANYDFGRTSTSWMIDPSTYYAKGNVVTVSSSVNNVINRLFFPTGSKNLDFNNINFQVNGSTNVQIDYLDAYFTKQELK